MCASTSDGFPGATVSVSTSPDPRRSSESSPAPKPLQNFWNLVAYDQFLELDTLVTYTVQRLRADVDVQWGGTSRSQTSGRASDIYISALHYHLRSSRHNISNPHRRSALPAQPQRHCIESTSCSNVHLTWLKRPASARILEQERALSSNTLHPPESMSLRYRH